MVELKIDQAELESLKEILARLYESYTDTYLPYANAHSALLRLNLAEATGPYAEYFNLCQRYVEIAQHIREVKTVDELRSYMKEVCTP